MNPILIFSAASPSWWPVLVCGTAALLFCQNASLAQGDGPAGLSKAELEAGGYIVTPGEPGYHFWNPGGAPNASAGLLPKTREGWKLHISGKKGSAEITNKTLLTAMKVLRELGIPHKVMPLELAAGNSAQDGKGIAAYPELPEHSDFHPNTAKPEYRPSDTKKIRDVNRGAATTRVASVIHLLDAQIRAAHNGEDAKNVPHDPPEHERQVSVGSPIYMRYGICQEKGGVGSFLVGPEPRLRTEDKMLTNPDNPNAKEGTPDRRSDSDLRNGRFDRDDKSKWADALKKSPDAKKLLTDESPPYGVPHWRQREFLDTLTKADGMKRITDSQELRGVIRKVVEKSAVKTAVSQKNAVVARGGPASTEDDPDQVIVSESFKSRSASSGEKKPEVREEKAGPGKKMMKEPLNSGKEADPDA